MQTFLPYPSFIESAKSLDNKRLGKQRVEAYQILNTLFKGPVTNGKKTAWYNHPAVQMWRGYEQSLAEYGYVICKEWRNRGFKDSLMDKFDSVRPPHEAPSPKWLGDSKFHSSHRSNLLRKSMENYTKFNWSETDSLPYFWPTKEGY